MASKVQLHLENSGIMITFHDGMILHYSHESPEEHLPKVKAMEIRHDDIMLCTYPKSGTHWLFRVIDMVQRGRAVFDKRTPQCTFLDRQRIERLPELDSPRILFSHLPADRLPQQLKGKRTKIVHVYRNPRAVLVSLYFMAKSAKPFHGSFDVSEFTIDKSASLIFFGDKMLYGGWFKYLDTMTAYQKENPDQPIFNISYEEMTLNPLETVQKLADFLDKPATAEFCGQVVAACGFHTQKETEEAANEFQHQLKICRHGDMNDWKNHLTVALDEKIEQVLKERASRCPFSSQY